MIHGPATEEKMVSGSERVWEIACLCPATVSRELEMDLYSHRRRVKEGWGSVKRGEPQGRRRALASKEIVSKRAKGT